MRSDVTVDGVRFTLTLEDPGRPHRHRGRNSGRTRTVTIDRRWRVDLRGVTLGWVEYRLFTREVKPKGLRYVTSRWTSPGWAYARPGGAPTREPYDSTRAACLRALLREAADDAF